MFRNTIKIPFSTFTWAVHCHFINTIRLLLQINKLTIACEPKRVLLLPSLKPFDTFEVQVIPTFYYENEPFRLYLKLFLALIITRPALNAQFSLEIFSLFKFFGFLFHVFSHLQGFGIKTSGRIFFPHSYLPYFLFPYICLCRCCAVHSYSPKAFTLRYLVIHMWSLWWLWHFFSPYVLALWTDLINAFPDDHSKSPELGFIFSKVQK